MAPIFQQSSLPITDSEIDLTSQYNVILVKNHFRANLIQLVLVLLLIGRKTGTRFLIQSLKVTTVIT